jgi:hypothetical protein
MGKLGQSPFTWLKFDADGKIEEGAVAELTELLKAPNIADLVVISHGWKNNEKDATNLYGTLWNHACGALASRKPENVVVAGVLWPAKEYETDFDEAAVAAAEEGQALAVGAGEGAHDLSDAAFDDELDRFRDLFGDAAAAPVIAAAKKAAEGLTGNRARDLLDAVVKVAGMADKQPDSELAADGQPFADADDAQVVIEQLLAPPQVTVSDDVGQAQGLDDVARVLINGPRAAVARFLNQTTYYEMKKRAGIVGSRLGAEIIPAVKTARPTRLHLVGHSFGARLVTAAASALPQPLPGFEFFSLTLLQGAFSHNALAQDFGGGKSGAFCRVIGRPSGPISITHTHNDRACTFWYALASRVARDVAAGIGGKNDKYGAMGANGAQKLAAGLCAPEHKGGPFKPVRRKVNGFLADAYIVKVKGKTKAESTDAHNNITNEQCGRLVAAVIDS